MERDCICCWAGNKSLYMSQLNFSGRKGRAMAQKDVPTEGFILHTYILCKYGTEQLKVVVGNLPEV